MNKPRQDRQTSVQAQSPLKAVTPVSPKKLLLSKWTAVIPQNKEKHFLVIGVVTPETPDAPVTEIDLEAAMTGRVQRLPWRELKNASKWKRGWI